jgi:hypothetical protein
MRYGRWPTRLRADQNWPGHQVAGSRSIDHAASDGMGVNRVSARGGRNEWWKQMISKTIAHHGRMQ